MRQYHLFIPFPFLFIEQWHHLMGITDLTTQMPPLSLHMLDLSAVGVMSMTKMDMSDSKMEGFGEPGQGWAHLDWGLDIGMWWVGANRCIVGEW